MSTDLAILSAASMTSREIADLVRSRHADVCRSIERLMESGVIAERAAGVFEEINNLGLPVKRRVYVFTGDQGKRDSIVVVAQLSPEFTARLVDRWQELESQIAAPRPITVAESLRITADILDRQAAQEAEQKRLAEELEKTNRRLDQIETASDHFTIVGWWRHTRRAGALSMAEAGRMGRKASAFCQKRKIKMGEVPDPRFGRVRTYPKWVLEEMFGSDH